MSQQGERGLPLGVNQKKYFTQVDANLNQQSSNSKARQLRYYFNHGGFNSKAERLNKEYKNDFKRNNEMPCSGFEFMKDKIKNKLLEIKVCQENDKDKQVFHVDLLSKLNDFSSKLRDQDGFKTREAVVDSLFEMMRVLDELFVNILTNAAVRIDEHEKNCIDHLLSNVSDLLFNLTDKDFIKRDFRHGSLGNFKQQAQKLLQTAVTQLTKGPFEINSRGEITIDKRTPPKGFNTLPTSILADKYRLAQEDRSNETLVIVGDVLDGLSAASNTLGNFRKALSEHSGNQIELLLFDSKEALGQQLDSCDDKKSFIVALCNKLAGCKEFKTSDDKKINFMQSIIKELSNDNFEQSVVSQALTYAGEYLRTDVTIDNFIQDHKIADLSKLTEGNLNTLSGQITDSAKLRTLANKIINVQIQKINERVNNGLNINDDIDTELLNIIHNYQKTEDPETQIDIELLRQIVSKNTTAGVGVQAKSSPPTNYKKLTQEQVSVLRNLSSRIENLADMLPKTNKAENMKLALSSVKLHLEQQQVEQVFKILKEYKLETDFNECLNELKQVLNMAKSVDWGIDRIANNYDFSSKFESSRARLNVLQEKTVAISKAVFQKAARLPESSFKVALDNAKRVIASNPKQMLFIYMDSESKQTAALFKKPDDINFSIIKLNELTFENGEYYLSHNAANDGLAQACNRYSNGINRLITLNNELEKYFEAADDAITKYNRTVSRISCSPHVAILAKAFALIELAQNLKTTLSGAAEKLEKAFEKNARSDIYDKTSTMILAAIGDYQKQIFTGTGTKSLQPITDLKKILKDNQKLQLENDVNLFNRPAQQETITKEDENGKKDHWDSIMGDIDPFSKARDYLDQYSKQANEAVGTSTITGSKALALADAAIPVSVAQKASGETVKLDTFINRLYKNVVEFPKTLKGAVQLFAENQSEKQYDKAAVVFANYVKKRGLLKEGQIQQLPRALDSRTASTLITTGSLNESNGVFTSATFNLATEASLMANGGTLSSSVPRGSTIITPAALPEQTSTSATLAVGVFSVCPAALMTELVKLFEEDKNPINKDIKKLITLGKALIQIYYARFKYVKDNLDLPNEISSPDKSNPSSVHPRLLDGFMSAALILFDKALTYISDPNDRNFDTAANYIRNKEVEYSQFISFADSFVSNDLNTNITFFNEAVNKFAELRQRTLVQRLLGDSEPASKGFLHQLFAKIIDDEKSNPIDSIRDSEGIFIGDDGRTGQTTFNAVIPKIDALMDKAFSLIHSHVVDNLLSGD